MRTKTLLLTAAALAAGFVSSFAQSSNVYSVNVVGYYNTTVPPNAFYFTSMQLKGTNNNNTINDRFNIGFVSDPAGVNNSQMLWWNGAGYATFQFYTAADSGIATGWFDLGGNLVTNRIEPGGGSFIFSPAGTNITYTVVGEVFQGSNNIPVLNGFNAFAISAPISTNIDSPVVKYPASSPGDGSGNTFDQFFYYTGTGFTVLSYYNAIDAAPFPAGFYDLGGTLQSTNPAFFPKVGQAFFIFHSGGPTNWVVNFTVN